LNKKLKKLTFFFFFFGLKKYILGWVLGTEWSPNTVNVTNIAHIGMQPYQGTYVEAAPSASPFETWCAMMLDKARFLFFLDLIA